MSEYDIYWYLLGGFIMAGIFLAGYKIGYNRGWRNGYRDYGIVLEQKMRFRAKAAEATNGEWDYKAREKRLSA